MPGRFYWDLRVRSSDKLPGDRRIVALSSTTVRCCAVVLWQRSGTI
jgi:hypothetical protein